MAEVKRFNTGRVKFTFTDENDEVFSSFWINPTDVNLIARAEEVSAYFDKRKDEIPEVMDTEAMQALNAEIEDKICYLLGYDARQDVFGAISATTISPDGEIFAWVLLDYIVEQLGPEMEKRRKKMQEGVAKYAQKYEK